MTVTFHTSSLPPEAPAPAVERVPDEDSRLPIPEPEPEDSHDGMGDAVRLSGHFIHGVAQGAVGLAVQLGGMAFDSTRLLAWQVQTTFDQARQLVESGALNSYARSGRWPDFEPKYRIPAPVMHSNLLQGLESGAPSILGGRATLAELVVREVPLLNTPFAVHQAYLACTSDSEACAESLGAVAGGVLALDVVALRYARGAARPAPASIEWLGSESLYAKGEAPAVAPSASPEMRAAKGSFPVERFDPDLVVPDLEAVIGRGSHDLAGRVLPGGEPNVVVAHSSFNGEGQPFVVPDGTAITTLRPGVVMNEIQAGEVQCGNWSGLSSARLRAEMGLHPDFEAAATWLPGARIPDYFLAPVTEGMTIREQALSLAPDEAGHLSDYVGDNSGHLQLGACTACTDAHGHPVEVYESATRPDQFDLPGTYWYDRASGSFVRDLARDRGWIESAAP